MKNPADALVLDNEAEALGSMILLCIQNDYYLDWSMLDIKKILYPAVSLGQYRIFRRNEQAIGFVTWAMLSDNASCYLSKYPAAPRPYEWRTGPRIWIMDFVCAPNCSGTVATSLKKDVFTKSYIDRSNAHADFAYAIRREADNSVRKVVKWKSILLNASPRS